MVWKILSQIDWTTAGAIIGGATGPAGVILAFAGYRRALAHRKSELRLVLHANRNAAEISSRNLMSLMPQVLGSRKAVMGARGLFYSGGMDSFQKSYGVDIERAGGLAKEIPSRSVNFSSLSQKELEYQIVLVDRVQRELDSLTNKYKNAFELDDEHRREIRTTARTYRP